VQEGGTSSCRSARSIDSKRARQPTSWGLLKTLESSSTSLLLVREGHGILEIDDERVGLCLTRAAKPINFVNEKIDLCDLRTAITLPSLSTTAN
jgi:hypothetical protein